MKWIKKGLIFGAQGRSEWMDNSALKPVPLLLGDIIRVFAAFRDKNGVSRMGYVDLNANNPSEVLNYSKEPILDIGEPGCFDDNGVVPCAIVEHKGKIYIYYSGYQLGHKVRFYFLGGLAISEDNGLTFKKYSKVPIMERTNNEFVFRSIQGLFYDEGKWKVYYIAGNSFFKGKTGKQLASYNLRYMETDSLFDFSKEGVSVINPGGDEYRIGSPQIIKEGNIYKMYYCVGSEDITYQMAYAESNDGINWIRDDKKLGLDLSETGWDSEMMAYPFVLNYKDKKYMFYNGNNFGNAGFGYAVLESE